MLLYRVLSWTLLIAVIAFTLLALGVRFLLLPGIGQYREPIADYLSKATKQHIEIGMLEGRWSGLNLQLTLGNIAVYDKANQPALTLARIDSTLSWWSLLHLEPRFDSIEIDGPDLNVRRNSRGIISVAGVELGGDTNGGLSDWLLEQRTILIHDATIKWLDEMRAAPELALQHVDFVLNNRGRHHRFGLRARPPENLATPLDLRGDLEGREVGDPSQWSGHVFAQLDYADIAAWRAWVEFPIHLPRGLGAMRAWATLNHGQPAEIIADVQLSKVTTRLGKDLPELDLDALSGRVAWKAIDGGFDVSTVKLSVAASNGIAMPPVDFHLRYFDPSAHQSAHGEVGANALDLNAMRALADYLPFEPEFRAELASYAPRGTVDGLKLTWKGTLPKLEQYSIAAKFSKLGLNAVGKLPGFAGISGRVDGNERSGVITLDSQTAAAELPQVFRDKLAFDTLAARVGWQSKDDQYEIKFDNIAFANADLAGTVVGTYKTAAAGRGVIDLSGTLNRAEARNVSRYIPLQIDSDGRSWLDAAFLGGNSNDVKVRLKGDLNEFPFADGKRGVFRVTAHVVGGVLSYATDWPKIENIDGDLDFHGHGMTVTARSATILGAKLARVRADIPQLNIPDRMLSVNGDAEGPTTEFLNYIQQSPISGMIDNFTQGIQAKGNGKLGLKLTIPLSRLRDTKVNGVYTFNNNVLDGGDLPFALEQASGRLEFSESTVRIPNATMTVLGGPASLNAAVQRDGTTRVSMAGRVNMDIFRRSSSPPSWVQPLHGSADWKAALTLRKHLADIVLDSNLAGISSDLPAPLNKTAAESLPLHLERRYTADQQERLVATLGTVVSAQLQRRRDGAQYVIERGVVNLGSATAASPDRKGIWITGNLRGLDLDRWLPYFQSSSSSAAAASNHLEVAGLDVSLGSMDVFGRRFNELAIKGTAQAGVWQSVQIAGRELNGELGWRPQGKGKITARLKTLVIPRTTATQVARVEGGEPLDLPALDIIADSFQLNDKVLGKLEVSALPDGRDWKIERLRITSPEATLNIDGAWQSWLTQSRTTVNLKLDVSDIGKLLTRLGYPEGIRRGTAKLEGPLSWSGGPAEFDYATLSGNFTVEAAKGQFVKLDPGVGKLLGILSLQSLPRRLSLDFRDVFSEGLAFDEISGAVKVNRGIASTDNFRIQGPAVRIMMSGDVDINAETQKLRVKIYPSISDSFSVAGALLGGPIAGIASFLVQKAFKDPLDQMVAYEYSVTGSWNEPQMVRVTAASNAKPAQKFSEP